MKKIYIYLIALLSGAIGVLAFSPFDYWPLAYISILGLLFVGHNPVKKTALLASFLWGIGFFTVGINWIHVSIYEFGGAPLILSYALVLLLAAYLSLYPLLFTYIIQRFKIKSFILFPIIWTLVEWLRANLFTGFPWLQFGYSQIDSPFSGIAPIFGVEGVTFFVVWMSTLLFAFLNYLVHKPKNKFLIAIPAILFFLLLMIGAYTKQLIFIKNATQDKALKVALLQGNIPQQLKWDPAHFTNTIYTYKAMIAENLDKADLIILPEAALPSSETNLQPFLDFLQKTAIKHHSEIMIGSLYFNRKQGRIFNSIIDLGNSQQPYSIATPNRYNKHHLVPFGEYVPLEKLLRPLGSIFNLPMSAFQSGAEIQPNLLAKGYHFAPAICYEIIFGSQLQKNIRKNTDFIITLSNDAWFGNSIGPWQHLQMARMRALELGKPLIRATNNGITVLTNGYGEIIAQAPQFVETTLLGTSTPTIGRTPYSVLGNKPLYFLILLILIFNGLATLIHKQLYKMATTKEQH